jgi:hypothetical protein
MKAAVCAVAVLAAVLWPVLAFQRPFREYPGDEYENFPLPRMRGGNRNGFSRG